MAAFLSNQLDFIFFFYGLAFILLGVTCRAIARSKAHGEAWAMLGLFGFVHGLSEWLDLSALILGDRAEFAALRTAVMTASYVFLLEFARLDGIRLGMKLPGRWIYVPLVMLVVLVGVVGGVRAAGITSRYAIGFVGSLGASAALASHASALWGGARRFALSASAGFVLYAIAAGLVVPVAPFWPASVFNTSVFASLTGMPIQLARGVLACCISFSIWASSCCAAARWRPMPWICASICAACDRPSSARLSRRVSSPSLITVNASLPAAVTRGTSIRLSASSAFT